MAGRANLSLLEAAVSQTRDNPRKGGRACLQKGLGGYRVQLLISYMTPHPPGPLSSARAAGSATAQRFSSTFVCDTRYADRICQSF